MLSRAMMTEREFWQRIRRQYLALASLIESQYPNDNAEPPRSSDEPRPLSSHR